MFPRHYHPASILLTCVNQLFIFLTPKPHATKGTYLCLCRLDISEEKTLVGLSVVCAPSCWVWGKEISSRMSLSCRYRNIVVREKKYCFYDVFTLTAYCHLKGSTLLTRWDYHTALLLCIRLSEVNIQMMERLTAWIKLQKKANKKMSTMLQLLKLDH